MLSNNQGKILAMLRTITKRGPVSPENHTSQESSEKKLSQHTNLGRVCLIMLSTEESVSEHNNQGRVCI
jgi:hypothetical protein